MLKIENLTKIYGSKAAVDHLNLHILPGEICGFIGHNGAGKTTTLKSCCGLVHFDEGSILIDGHSIRQEPITCKQIMAYLPDNPDLYEFMTGIQYLNFVADIYKVTREDREAGIREYGSMLGMVNDLALPISSDSHGMKQKIALIAALLHKPKLMLMDEPFVGLDPMASHQLKTVMKQMCREGCAILFSTHVLEVAEKLCDKVAIIKGGKLVAFGTMDEVKGNASLEDVFLELEERHD